jgi:phage shock protein A
MSSSNPDDMTHLYKTRHRLIEQHTQLVEGYKKNPDRDFLDEQKKTLRDLIHEADKEINDISSKMQQVEQKKSASPAQLNFQRDSTESKKPNAPSMPASKSVEQPDLSPDEQKSLNP